MKEHILRQLIKEEILSELEADKEAKSKVNKGISHLKNGGSLILKGYKKEAEKYKTTAKTIKKIINKEPITAKEKSVMRSTIADLILRVGIIAVGSASAGAVLAGFSTSMLKVVLKKGIVNAAGIVGEDNEKLTDIEALELLSQSLGKYIEQNKSAVEKIYKASKE